MTVLCFKKSHLIRMLKLIEILSVSNLTRNVGINSCLFSLSAVFHLESVGSNMTTLWAAEAGLYVGIDNRGNVITSVSICVVQSCTSY